MKSVGNRVLPRLNEMLISQLKILIHPEKYSLKLNLGQTLKKI
jgi:hypothetical protein